MRINSLGVLLVASGMAVACAEDPSSDNSMTMLSSGGAGAAPQAGDGGALNEGGGTAQSPSVPASGGSANVGGGGVVADGGANGVPAGGQGPGAGGQGPDAGGTGGMGGAPVAADCDNLPAFPPPVVEIEAVTGEDFHWTTEGELLGVPTNNGNVYYTERDQKSRLVLPAVVEDARGQRMMPNGDIVIANMGEGIIYRVTPAGDVTPWSTGLDGPNGIIFGPGGVLYVSNPNVMAGMGTVSRVDPDSGEHTHIATLVESIDGLAFSPDEKTLYVNTFNRTRDQGKVFKMAVNPDGTVQEPELLAADVGTWPDGMTVDECGNMYSADHSGEIVRITPLGQVDLVIDFKVYTPAANFGSGLKGWDNGKLYVGSPNEGVVYELDLGVRGKVRTR